MLSSPEFPRVSDYAAYYGRQTPDAVALKLMGVSTSYSALAEQVDALARALLAAGVVKGDRVATLQSPHPDHLVAFLATASIGGIWVGLNPRYQLDELRYVMDDCQPTILLARTRIGARDYDPEVAILAKTPSLLRTVTYERSHSLSDVTDMDSFLLAGEVIGLDALAAARGACGNQDPCLIVYTSGSTGKPKGALLHHAGIIRFSREQNALWPISPVRVQNFLPINHIGSLVDISMPALVAGGFIAFLEQFEPGAALAMIAEESLTLWGSIPSVFALQLAMPDFDQYDLSSVKLIVWEGAPMPDEMLDRLLSLGLPLATNYGMTETTSAVTALPPTRDRHILSRSTGIAFPGVEIRLVDAADADVADGEPGEVLARSSSNFLGYWARPEATAAAFTYDGFFRTGDVAVRASNGHLRLVGRIKEMFKSGGYNVYPREVEVVLEAHPAVALVAVVARPDPLWHEVGIAYVVLGAGDPVDAMTLLDWCRARLANYKIPKDVKIVTELPLLPIGKVDKIALKRQAVSEASIASA